MVQPKPKLVIARSILEKFAFTIMVMASFGLPSASGQTGDSTIDSWISGFARTGGNNLAPTALDPINYYATGLTKCNSSGAPPWEAKCPSDLLYTPNANTGGYQAFGVGVSNWPGGTYWYPVCYLVWVYYQIDPSLPGYWQLEVWCDWYYVQMADHTYGAAAARLLFGLDSLNTPWGLVPMSTLAFKANSVYTPADPSVVCTPNWGGTDAPCLEPDSYAVPSVGYEDKVLIQDNNCQKITRAGDASDASAGCFVRDGGNWLTDLPSPYPDTTALDGPSTYVASIGSIDPGSLAEGLPGGTMTLDVYFWWINFYQWGLEAGSNHSIQHNSAVTTYVPVPQCTSSTPWWCFFNVDQTTIAPAATVP